MCIICNDIVDIQIPLDYETQKHRGFAFIEFEMAEQIMASGEDRHPTTIDAVVAATQFECPICYNLGRPAIQTCMSGHLVCLDCIGRIDNQCPTCQGAMGIHKNLIPDNLAHLLTYSCLHSFSGCWQY